MDTFVDCLMREYFCEYCQQNGETGSFQCFQPDDTASYSGIHSHGLSGRLLYTKGDHSHYSGQLFVKYLVEDQSWEPSSPIYWFHTEVHFYTRVVPILESLRSIRHLIPRFLHSKDATKEAGPIAIVFEHLQPHGFRNPAGYGDYAHLSLMARKLGEFHAYSFAARKLSPGQLERVASLPYDSYVSQTIAQQAQTVRTLSRALEPLEQDPECEDGVPRVRQILANFVDSVTRAFAANGSKADDFVLCHRSYTRFNVLFRYAKGAPVDMVIMDWQTMAFASLGVDLGLLLYVEVGQTTRNEYWNQLLDDYHEALGTTFVAHDVPSREHILDQLRISVPATLNMLVYRVAQMDSDSSENSRATCNLRLVSEVLKDMILRKLI